MPEPYADHPIEPVADLALADAETLVEMGILEPQAEPEPRPKS